MLLAFVQASFVCGPERAEEVVQRTLVRAVRSIPRYDAARGRLRDWLKGICRNEAVTLLNQEARQIRFSGVDGSVRSSLERIDEALIPEHVLARQEVQWLIHETVGDLRPSHRRVLTLKYLSGRKVSEIAQAMGQSEKATESLLSRARQAFRNALLARTKRLGERVDEVLL
ncbi:MAG: sigma-70 family RNA polymerase sigma factor [Phycisphaerales bacterium]|nr:MAG: sigma-70 family RNA polymerase sigma factor [Phycisphaerales bacterium]